MSMRPYNAKQVTLSEERVYDLILSPLVTEKTTLLGEPVSYTHHRAHET